MISAGRCSLTCARVLTTLRFAADTLGVSAANLMINSPRQLGMSLKTPLGRRIAED